MAHPCVAFVKECGPYCAYEKVNVEGTRQLLLAARHAGVRRFVHISTEAALFYGQPMRDVDETCPLAVHSPFPYSKTKALAEIAVNEASDSEQNLSTIILRPRLIWGPGDQTVLPAVLKMSAANKFAWIDHGEIQTSTTHIHNLVHAIDLPLEKGGDGEAFFVLDGPPVSFRKFMAAHAKTDGTDLGERSIPGWLVRTVTNVIEPLWRLTGMKSPPPISRFTAYVMSRDCILNDTKARSILGSQPKLTLEEGLNTLAGS